MCYPVQENFDADLPQFVILYDKYKIALLYLSILWAGVQPTLDPCAEAFYSRPIALTLGGEEFFG